MFLCCIHHPQGELLKPAQNCQLFTKLLHNCIIKYKTYEFCKLTMNFKMTKTISSNLFRILEP